MNVAEGGTTRNGPTQDEEVVEEDPGPSRTTVTHEYDYDDDYEDEI